MLNKVISQYRIVEKIGQGAMGVVYRAEDLKLKRSVAIKMLPYDLGADEERKTRFLQEARAASSIDHPNIGTIYEINETPEGDLFIVMAYYEGETLKERMRRGPIALGDALSIAYQISSGMERAHATGIIHRDLKPANILLTLDGSVRIIDFGLAKFIAGAQLTRSGLSVGTAAYMSPEQIVNRGVDERSDIWAFGVILYQMLAGALPFKGEFESALLYSIANESPNPLSALRGDVPAEIVQLVDRCLEKDPERRPQQMSEVVQVLLPFQPRGSTTPFVVSRPPTGRTNPKRRSSAAKRSVPIVLAAVLVVTAAAWVYFTRNAVENGGRPPIDKSLAVLPFVNRGDSVHEYYADGLTGDLRQDLARVPGLLVISNVSSSFYKEHSADLERVSHDLGVRYILEGEIQLFPRTMRIHVSLYDASTGGTAWKAGYDIARNELPATKNAILTILASNIGLDPGQIPLQSVDPGAYDLYLQGMHYRQRVTKEGALLAEEYLSQAVHQDSSFVPALLNLATTKYETYRRGWTREDRTLDDVAGLCDRVLRSASGPGHPQAVAILGGVASLRGHLQEAMTLLLRSIADDPNNDFALTEAALLYMSQLGEPIKAIPLLKKLEEIDPENSLYLSNLGVAYAQLKMYPEAIGAFMRSAAHDASNPLSYLNMAYAYERLGRYDSAATYYSVALEKDPSEAQSYESLASLLFTLGKPAAAESLLAGGVRFLPDNQQVLYVFGIANTRVGKGAEAVRAFEDGVRITNVRIRQNPGIGQNYSWRALFLARLRDDAGSVASVKKALECDASDEEILMKAARTYALLGRKETMLGFFKKARRVNAEYDLSYLATALDFDRYRSDPDLQFAARGE